LGVLSSWAASLASLSAASWHLISVNTVGNIHCTHTVSCWFLFYLELYLKRLIGTFLNYYPTVGVNVSGSHVPQFSRQQCCCALWPPYRQLSLLWMFPVDFFSISRNYVVAACL
jgi:hypothetical protein